MPTYIFNPLETDIDLNYTTLQKFCSRLTRKKLKVQFKGQSVKAVIRNNLFLFWDLYKTLKCTLWENANSLNVKELVYIII